MADRNKRPEAAGDDTRADAPARDASPDIAGHVARPASPAGPDIPGAIGSALMIAVGAAALAYSGDFSELGSVFPRAIGALLIAFGALYIVFVLLGRTRRAPPQGGSNLRRLGVALVMLGWAFALAPLGFLGSSALAFVALLGLAQYDRWTPRTLLLYGGAGAVVLGGLYTLFKFALQVPLP